MTITHARLKHNGGYLCVGLLVLIFVQENTSVNHAEQFIHIISMGRYDKNVRMRKEERGSYRFITRY